MKITTDENIQLQPAYCQPSYTSHSTLALGHTDFKSPWQIGCGLVWRYSTPHITSLICYLFFSMASLKGGGITRTNEARSGRSHCSERTNSLRFPLAAQGRTIQATPSATLSAKPTSLTMFSCANVLRRLSSWASGWRSTHGTSIYYFGLREQPTHHKACPIARVIVQSEFFESNKMASLGMIIWRSRWHGRMKNS